MKTKLLQKTQYFFILYSSIILVLSAPIFYFSIDKLYLKEANDTLLLRKKEFEILHSKTIQINQIKDWNIYNRNVKIEKSAQLISCDSLFTEIYFDDIDNENEPYRVLLSPITIQGKPFVFSARINLVEKEDLILNIAILFTGLLLLLLFGIYIISKIISKKLWAPFYQTLHKLEHYDIDKNDEIEFNETKIEEFNRLNSTVEKLIYRNNSIFKSQKEFIENAAHEMQTPLAVFKSKLELLQQQSNFTKDQYDILEKLNTTISRLTKLNKNLLLLSRVENQQFKELETVDWSAILNKLYSFYKEQAEVKNISIELIIIENPTTESNLVLAEILVSNLFLNAIKHNIQNGKVIIELNSNEIRFSNSGEEKALESYRLFKRFSKKNSSKDGTGLGLSIVKKICEQNNWKVEYKFENLLHFFSLKF